MRCPSCGRHWPDDQRFCGSCGHALDTQAGFREERKVITVLFCDLVGSTARADGSDPEDVEALMRPYHECVRTELTRYGATVEKFIGDAVMAVFGAPAAHEDDGERAVRAGLRILEAIGELNTAHPGLDLEVRIGVATGEAIARLGARPERGEGLVVGDVVNTAARLQTAAAPGSVVVAEATHQLTAGHFDWLELEPVTVKGKVAPLPVWRPLASRAGSGAHRPSGPEPPASRPAGVSALGPALSAAPFVGRDRDLAVLRAAFGKTVGERAPQLVTVLGEAGIGKSRLAAELRRALQAHEGEVVWRVGHCRPYGDGTSLSALADIVKAQAGVIDTDTTAAAVAKIRAALPEDERTDLEPRLTPLVGADPGVTQSRFESFSAWRRFIEIIAETTPAVLVVEDLHWAAPMLLDFVEDLVAGLAEVPVLVVATARPELLDGRPGWGSGSVSLRLSPLPEREVAAMLDALLGSAPSGRSRGELVTRCGGVPLYAEQFAQLASQYDSATVPPTLAALIGARLDTLNREHRAVLQTAAVAGSPFWDDEVEVLTGAAAHVVTAALGTLVRRQFLRRVSPSTRAGQAEFVFWHDLVRDAAEARLTRLDRARRHLAVSQWWAAAAAGARLLGIDTPGALRLLARALELSDEDSPVRARILCWFGTALSDDRQFERSEQVLIEAVQQLERRNDPLRVDAIFSLTVALFALGHDWEPALKAARRAASTLPPSRQAVRNLATLAMAELIGQNPQSLRNAVALADRAIQMAADHGTGGDAFAHIVRGRALLSLGDGRGMDELESRLDDALQHESGTWAVAARMWFAGALHHWRGPAAELKARQEAMVLADNRGLQLYRSMSIAEEVRVLYELGRFGEAIALAEQIPEADVEAQPRWGVVQRALALLDTGALDDATVEVVRHAPPADEGDLRHILGVALVRAAAAIRHGHAAEAGGMLKDLGDLQRYSERDGAVELLPRLVRTAIAAGCLQTVTGLRDIAAVPTPLRLQIAATVDGLIQEIHGRPAAAAGQLRNAASGWEALGYRVESAFTHHDLARNLRAASDPDAKSATGHAETLCRELGLVPLLHTGA